MTWPASSRPAAPDRFVRPEGAALRCFLCPRRCLLAPGRSGFCGVRRNEGGALVSLADGFPAALQVDPIEKKPLYHFLPGTFTFSCGTFGCNLRCANCQNDELSRGLPAAPGRRIAPDAIVRAALEHGCRSVAFTYNEPTIWAGYAIDIAEAAHAAGLATVLVSNAFITPEAAEQLFPVIDAANFDLKSGDPAFYRRICRGELAPVLAAIGDFFARGRHLEITNLLIPGLNDAPEQVEQLLDALEPIVDRTVPLHFSRFFPRCELRDLPPTPPERVHAACAAARARGYRYVHAGNL